MSNRLKHVFNVKYVAHQVFETILAKRPDVKFDCIESHGDDRLHAPILAAAHACQITSARDEIPPKFYADKELFRRTPNLLIVSTNGAGYDTVNVAACTEAGVLVVNQAGGNKEAVAEHVLGLMLCLSKRIFQVDRALRKSEAVDRNAFMGNDIHGKTIGIVGLGHTGGRVAQLCRGLFAMRVLACDPYLSAAEMAARGAEKADLGDVLRAADYVSINCPLTDETRGMIGAREFALMQPHAYFITTARGFIHDENALADALRARKIAGAGLDVWAKEPPPYDHPLLQFDNVAVSPHTAGVTVEARANNGRIAAEQLLDIFDGKRPPRLVNPEVWPAYAKRFERAFDFSPGETPALPASC